MKNRRWIVTCEHGGNQVPEDYAPLFSGYADILHSHRGWDPGAFEVAELLAGHLKARFFFTTITRLLVDCNRSPGNPEVFSEISRWQWIRQNNRLWLLCWPKACSFSNFQNIWLDVLATCQI